MRDLPRTLDPAQDILAGADIKILLGLGPALKPGGEFFIEDHAAAPGTGISTTDALHRIDEDFLKKEVESVGFVLARESDILRNPADDHTLNVFKSEIRGHTDQFLLVFKKPK